MRVHVNRGTESPEACSTTSSAVLITAFTALPSNPLTASNATSTKLVVNMFLQNSGICQDRTRIVTLMVHYKALICI